MEEKAPVKTAAHGVKISVEDVISGSWKVFKSNWLMIILTFIVFGVLYYASSFVFAMLIPMVAGKNEVASSILSIIGGLINNAICLILTLGLIKYTFVLLDGNKPEMSELFRNYRYFWKCLLASILFGLLLIPFLVVGGIIVGVSFLIFQEFNPAVAIPLLLALMVPYIFVSIRLYFYEYFIVDKNVGAVDSLKMSWDATKGNVWRFIFLALALLALNILGALLLLVGLLVTIPMSFIAYSYAYRRLSGGKIVIHKTA